MKNHRDIVHSLCEALLDGRNDVAQRMIYSNDIANEVDADGYTLLFYATVGGNCDGIRMLIDAGADCDKLSSNGDAPPFGLLVSLAIIQCVI